MRDYRYLIINEYTLLYYISMTCFLILFKSTALSARLARDKSAHLGMLLMESIIITQPEFSHTLGHEETLRLKRVYAQGSTRNRSVNYHHVIHSLVKKPNAFRYSLIRDDLIPDGDFTLLWQQLTQDGISDSDCRYMVDLLALAHNYRCEAALGRYVLKEIKRQQKPSIRQCRAYFSDETIDIPCIENQQHDLNSYDELMGGHHG